MSLTLQPLPETSSLRPVLDHAEVVENPEIAPEHFRLVLRAPRIAARARPGQFAMLTVAGSGELAPVLPRPMALYGWEAGRGEVAFVYRIVGEGTYLLSTRQPGDRIETVGPLGRGFAVDPAIRGALLIGRGIGVCSLIALAEGLAASGVPTHALVSARRRQALLGLDLFERLGIDVTAVTDREGTSPVPVVRALLDQVLDWQPLSQVFVCGSRRLLELGAELGGRIGAEVQVSLEAHMACGLGYCHGCSTGFPGLPDEAPLVCRDGPVFVCSAGSVVGAEK